MAYYEGGQSGYSADPNHSPHIPAEGRESRSPYYFDKITLDADGKRYLSMTGATYEADSWKMRIGLHTFNIPPLSVSISEVNSNIQTAYLLRSRTASKASPGKKIRQVSMSFVFPNLSKGDIRLWGTLSNGLEAKRIMLDKDISTINLALENEMVNDSGSFRGFLAQFQNSPFLPVYNTYLNDVFGIQALGLVSLTAKMIPGLPNSMQVEIVAYEFNWKTYVPNAGTFDEIFSWDKYTDYFVRSIRRLHEYAGIPFTDNWLKDSEFLKTAAEEDKTKVMKGGIGENSIYEEWLLKNYGPITLSDTSMNAIELFWSDEQYQKLNWLNSLNDYAKQTKLYDMPTGASLWESLNNFVFKKAFESFLGEGSAETLTEEDFKGLLKDITGQSSTDMAKSYTAFNAIVSMADYYITYETRSTDIDKFAQDILIAEERIIKKTGWQKNYNDDLIRKAAIYTTIINTNQEFVSKILESPAIRAAFISDALIFKGEWEIPMKRMGLMNYDLKKTVILEDISVTTQNAISIMPITGKTTPTMQYLGGLGTKVSLQFKVIGEAALQLFQKTFDQINGAALSNKDIVVSSVVGIQNEIVNMFGVKYALIDQWQVDTIPNYPHTYNVSIVLSDFDILQQKRETPQTKEKFDLLDKELATMSSDSSPFTRMRQLLPFYNAYPDLPLPTYEYEVNALDFDMTSTGAITVESAPQMLKRRRYFDPDYYFKRIEWHEFNRGPDGTPIVSDGTVKTFNSEGEVADGITSASTIAMLPGSEIGSNLPIGSAPSMTGYMITNFDSRTQDGGGKYNIAVSFKSSEVLGQIAKVNSAENEDIFTEENSKIKGYMNGKVDDITSVGSFSDNIEGLEGVQVDLTSSGRLYQITESAQAMTGYSNGSPVQGQTGDGMTGKLQLIGTHEPVEGDDLDFAAKAALYNMYEQDEREAYAHMLLDMKYRDITGRMVQAFPNYAIYIIDEGGNVHGYKLFDTFFGMQSAISMDIMLDKDAPMDTAIVQFSNLSSRLTTAQWYNNLSLPDFIKRWYVSLAANTARINGIITDNNGYFELTPGMRLQVRLGYSANADLLPIVFNGTVTSAELGDICTVIAAGDGAELNVVTGPNVKSGQTTMTHLGVPIVDATSTILRMLASNGTTWQELNQRAWAGLNPGETAASSGHFGAILWDTAAFGGDAAWRAKQAEFQKKISTRANNMAEKLFEASQNADITGQQTAAWHSLIWTIIKESPGQTGGLASDITDNYIGNLVRLKRDYEIYKRNIYPTANGGYRDYVNQIDRTLASPQTGWWALMKQVANPVDYIDDETTTWFDNDGNWVQDTEAVSIGLGILLAGTGLALLTLGPLGWMTIAGAATAMAGAGLAGTGLAKVFNTTWRTRRITLNTGGKTNWQIMQDAASTVPNYVLGVRMFENRSTLFFGKQNWLYTSGVMPLFEPETLGKMKGYMRSSSVAFATGVAGQEYSSQDRGAGSFWKEYAGSGTGMWYIPGEDNWFYYWLADRQSVIELAKRLGTSLVESEEMASFHFDKSNRAKLSNVAEKMLTGQGETALELKPIPEFISWMKNSPIVNDYFVARASVELEMYRIPLTEKQSKNHNESITSDSSMRMVRAQLSSGALTNDVFNHHLAYRYATPDDSMTPPQTKQLTWSKNEGHSEVAVDIGDIASIIPVVAMDTVAGLLIGAGLSLGVGAPVGAVIGALIGVVSGIDQLGSFYYEQKNTNMINTIAWLYRAWNRASVDEDGNVILKDYDREFMKSLLDENHASMAQMIEASEKGNPHGAQSVVEIEIGEASSEINEKDKITIAHSREAISKGFFSVNEASVTAKSAAELAKEHAATYSIKDGNLGETGKALAAFTGIMTGGIDTLVGSSVVGDTAANLAWDCLQDSVYYGVTGTPEDPYKWDRYEGWEKLQKDGYKGIDTTVNEMEELTGGEINKDLLNADSITQMHYEKDLDKLTTSERIIRRWQVITDNPFSKEYGEPVVEIREPFSKWHYATSSTNIMSNTVRASSEDFVYNKIRAVAHTTGKNNGKREQVASADTSIPPQYIREGVVDTGYNYQLFNALDEVNHKNMARYHLKKSLQNMYDGEVTILGNPHIRPFDFFYIFDVPNAMHGTCEVGRVIHSFNIQNGYTTSVLVQPIIAVDDAYQFGWTTTTWHLQEEEAIRRLASQNILAGFTDANMQDAALSDVQRKDIHQKTLGVLNNVVKPQTIVGGTQLTCSQLLSNAMNIYRDNIPQDGDPGFEEWQAEKERHEQILKDSKSEGAAAGAASGAAIGAAAGAAIGLAFFGAGAVPGAVIGGVIGGIGGGIAGHLQGEDEGVKIVQAEIKAEVDEIMENQTPYYADNVGAQEMAEALIVAISTGADSVSIGGTAETAVKIVGTLGSSAAPYAAVATPTAAAFGLATPTTASVVAILTAFASIWGAFKIREWAVKFAESEPITIILLNKDGKPLEAGLKGADGIIVGKPMTMGWVSDFIRIPLPTIMDETVYNSLGMSLTDAYNIRAAKSYGEKLAALDVLQSAGAIEIFGVDNYFVCNDVEVSEVIDGDTIKISGPIVDRSTNTSYTFDNNSIRLWGINTPEISNPAQVGAVECKDALDRYIKESGGKISIVFNRMSIKDSYQRGLGILIGSSSPHHRSLDDWVRQPHINTLNIFQESLNFRLENEFRDKGYVSNLFVSGYSAQEDYVARHMNEIGDS